MKRGLCIFCHIAPITGRNRKYCAEHSRLASTLWKRTHRRLWKAAGDKYWLADWNHKTPDERRSYFREYMREYRRRRIVVPISGKPSLSPGRSAVGDSDARRFKQNDAPLTELLRFTLGGN